MKKQAKKKKFDRVMREFAAGTLKSSSGHKVTSKAQALAIAYSESGTGKKQHEKKEMKEQIGFYVSGILGRMLEEKSKKKLDRPGKEDADIDNNGVVDGSDRYLHNRRKKRGKAIAKHRASKK